MRIAKTSAAMELPEVKSLYRSGRLNEAAEAARRLKPESSDQAREMIYGVQALMEMGRFGEAAAMGRRTADQCSTPESAALTVQSAYAAMMASPCPATREAVRTELTILTAQENAFSQAMAKRWDARLLALEIALSRRSLREMPEVAAALEEAVQWFRKAGCVEEARSELIRLADQIRRGPQRNAAKAATLLSQLKAEALEAEDWPAVARASLSLAEIDFEGLMGGAEAPGAAAIRAALEAFEKVQEHYRTASMPAGEAEALASLGRQLMRYGEASGADYLRAAAQSWEEAGHHGAADGAWRDLHLWHSHRADRDQLEAHQPSTARLPL